MSRAERQAAGDGRECKLQEERERGGKEQIDAAREHQETAAVALKPCALCCAEAQVAAQLLPGAGVPQTHGTTGERRGGVLGEAGERKILGGAAGPQGVHEMEQVVVQGMLRMTSFIA